MIKSILSFFSRPIWWYVQHSPRPIRKSIQWLCEWRGHIVGDTGYSGGKMLKVYCKWCNYFYQIPLSEMPSREYLKELYES